MGFRLSFPRKKVTAAAVPPPPSPTSPSSAVTWPSCRHPRTDSSRADVRGDRHREPWLGGPATEEWRHSDESSKLVGEPWSSTDVVIRALASDGGSRRLLFDPVGTTSSIMEESKAGTGFPFKEGKVLVVESKDPYGDFRASMEEMVAAHGVAGDLAALRELLEWYLKVNQDNTHELILEAFVDLFLQISSSPSSSLSARSSCSSPTPTLKEIVKGRIGTR